MNSNPIKLALPALIHPAPAVMYLVCVLKTIPPSAKVSIHADNPNRGSGHGRFRAERLGRRNKRVADASVPLGEPSEFTIRGADNNQRLLISGAISKKRCPYVRLQPARSIRQFRSEGGHGQY